ncbi:hypothetical protein [Nostoc sp. ChiQUE01b]|uniref:hypothetical protein n=1 Tax=Nostoc sp. ChiQUE01b TaxID=3075376 RepID=UPI002AD220DC|nr:hypothetical protein [Nostoc sp. ChiQUE01b]MDZ8258200.1 hypothetical protein [Nostoc sp. ChiQUE01b]
MDREVVLDGNWLTTCHPDDIPAFNREMLNLFAQFAPTHLLRDFSISGRYLIVRSRLFFIQRFKI